MKKILVAAFFLLSMNLMAQDGDYNSLKPTEEIEINSSNDVYIKCIEHYPTIADFNPDENGLKLYKTGNGDLTYISIPLNNENYTHAIVWYNSKLEDFMLFYTKVINNEELFTSATFDENELLLYEIQKEGNTFTVSISENRITCFSKCMDVTEDEFEETISGWIAWNLHPPVQILAAGHCKGCCKGWWKQGCDGKM